ncbi:TonB-dependent receptor domain-containing protein [Arsukibacterium sp.]|uniref:TonB-dependent receptor domain-containing protein n=1 Tax=Arsukibacterium sp. TaxID=1977258 RepID=UPI00299F05F8|nr:TonB-dependent receptor [Arsukibacterium sp.]MDX1539454.1 TonB-dependent receptor [Arsukibacterium sp.]
MRKLTPLALAIAGSLLASPFSYAQQETAKEEQKVERIEVTGSRIKGVDLEGTQPLVVISAEDIKNSGASSVYDLLKDLGQVRGGSGTFSTSESGATSTSTPAGQAAASLRGLGPSSTLTLVNGRRVAASSFAAGTQNFVDVNSIPLAAIERIEVLATGASAIYGADAVAGVINYILKKDYEGAELNLSYGNSTASSDDSRINANIVIGTELAGGNLTLFADLYDRKGYTAQDREFTRDPNLVSNYSYLPKGVPNIYYWSAVDGNEIASPGCTSPLVTTELGEEICAYYANQDDVLETPFESASAGFNFRKEFSNNLIWNTDFFYSHTSSVSSSSPAPINQISDEEGPWVQETALDVFPDAVRDSLLDQIYIDPFTSEAGQRLWGFRFDARFNTPRTVEVTSDSFRLVSSLAGSTENWDWETAVLLSRSESEQQAIAGIYNRYKYHAAIAGELCQDGSIASYDSDADSLSCSSGAGLAGVYNPFLANDSANEALLALAQEVPTRDGVSTVYGWDARFSGDLFEFNGQLVRSAFGLELRKEEITDTPSANAQASAANGYLVDVFGFGSSLSAADRTQMAAFAEIYAPLTDTIELQLAGRYDHYDDFGSTFNPKVGITWRPLDSLVMRASWATSFRAPSLTQAGVKLRTTTATFDCSANQTVSDLYCEGAGFTSSPNVLELGNAALQAETSESVSVGFGWSPTQDTTLTVDYWQFEHKKLVDTDMTAMLARTATDASVRHCGLVPDGELGISYDPALCDVTDSAGRTVEDDGANMAEILDAWVEYDNPRFAELPLFRDHVIQLDNVGRQDVSGIDARFSHTLDLAGGRLGLDLDWTHYLEFDRNKAGSDEVEALIGTFRYPENIGSASISWSGEALYLGLTALYTSSYQDDTARLRSRNLDELDELGLIDADGNRDVSSWTTLRANIGYDFEHASLNFTVDNLLDRDPPAVYGNSRGFDSINHNAFGRNYRVSFSYFF